MIGGLILVAGVFATLGYTNLRWRGGREAEGRKEVPRTQRDINPANEATLSIGAAFVLILFTVVALITFYWSRDVAKTSLASSTSEVSVCQAPKGSDLLTAYGGEFKFHRSIDTSSELAQKLFDRGLLHLYGYNQVEARRGFEAYTTAPC